MTQQGFFYHIATLKPKIMELQYVSHLLPGITFVLGCLITALWLRRKSNEQMCRRIARDLHDNLGSSLSNICLLSGLVNQEMTKTGNGQAGEFLQRITTEAEKVHESISDTAKVLGPEYRQLGSLAALLNRHGYELLHEKGIDFALDLPESIKPITIPVTRRHDMYLILKEAIHNIMQHSGASQTRISFRADCRNLYCRVQDNGCGFDFKKHREGSGLANMMRRSGLIQAALDIRTAPGEGCMILLRVPLRPSWYPLRLCKYYSKSLDGFEELALDAFQGRSRMQNTASLP